MKRKNPAHSSRACKVQSTSNKCALRVNREIVTGILTVGIGFLGSLVPIFANETQPNILFIAVDDLRPELGCYGKSYMHTPNIDALGARGMIFDRAYAMVPVCGASRASMMTGLRPNQSRFLRHDATAEDDAPGITTLNTHFRNHGYTTISNGKVFHKNLDNAHGWSERPWRPTPPAVFTYHLPENIALLEERRHENRANRGVAWEASDVPDDEFWDGRVTQKSIEDLRRLASQGEPFFLAVGYFNPHLPFVAPQRFWDMYDPEEIVFCETYGRVPDGAPAEAIHHSGELRPYANIPDSGPISDVLARNLMQGYYACVSHIDSEIGKLLAEVDALGLAENTLIILWGDHGWNLGEHTLWCKHSCFDISLRVPLILAAPGMPGNQRTRGMIESIDIYPSLCELAGIPVPAHADGISFAPLLENPEQDWKTAVYSRYLQGDSVKTDQFRFTEYRSVDGTLLSRMLYDHHLDPREANNISELEDSAAIAERLSHKLEGLRR